MLTMPGRSGHRVLLLSVMLLAGCSARPVLHEFPQPLAPEARPPSAVAYELREDGTRQKTWVLRGAEGDVVGTFRWDRSYRKAEAGALDRSEDFRRDDRLQDGINGLDYLFRLSSTSDDLKSSSGWGTAPPRVTIFDATSGERVGELELRTGFDRRYEGIWRGRAVLWRAEVIPAGSVKRESDEGSVEDFYPAAQLARWEGGSNANLTVYSGRAVEGGQFKEALYDVTAGRPLTRRELGDAIVMLFALRAVEEADLGARTLRED